MKPKLEIADELPLHQTYEPTSPVIGTQYDIARASGHRTVIGTVTIVDRGISRASIYQGALDEVSSIDFATDFSETSDTAPEDVALCAAAAALHPNIANKTELLDMLGIDSFANL
jgi:hypothetical protein